jgi:uncharacterized protein YggE
MKISMVLWILVGAATLAWSGPRVPDSQVERSVTVYGRGEIAAPADFATLSFVVRGFGPRLKEAADAAVKKSGELATRIAALGIPLEAVQTSAFYNGPAFAPTLMLSKNRESQVPVVVQVRVDSLRLLDKLIFLLSEQEAENLSVVSFGLRDSSAAALLAIDSAVADARRQAARLCAGWGVQAGKLISCEVLDGTPVGSRSDEPVSRAGVAPESRSVAQLPGPAAAVTPDRIRRSATVKAVIQIAP